MTPNNFTEFYEGVHGRPPFRWQVEFALSVAAGSWPDTVRLPTSSGKTSIIDIAVFLLALDAGKPLVERRAALRTFFVVDRRVVVDEAYEHALKVAEALNLANSGVVAEVATRLKLFKSQVPLQVSRMRGGMLRDSGWADEPNQPLICLSTVDQLGSRLLFRGYQLRDVNRSVHAGLVGSDSLIILDEAHLSNPFAETARTIAEKYALPTERFPRVVTMSATPKQAGHVFRMLPEWIDADSEFLKPRLAASKPAELREPKKLEDEMILAAKQFGAELPTGVVGVIANTVASARTVFDGLSGDKVLLVGRNRPWCAEQLWNKYKARIEAKPSRISEKLLYVVATQTVEVGANISFDALVTESAPIDALRQRFGRLNRLGEAKLSKAVIVLRPKGDLVYGGPTAATWQFLKTHKPINFGVLAMDALVGVADPGQLESMESSKAEAPLLFPGHLDLWAQTNPEPAPDPDVAPFLHGPEALEASDVQIVWRDDLKEDEAETWQDLVALVPPVLREALPMPIRAVRAWLKDLTTDVADVEGIPLRVPDEKKARTSKPALVWGGKEQPHDPKRLRSEQIRPGSTIVVPTTYGGADELGWNPKAIPKDVFDEINRKEFEDGLRQRVVRLDLAAKDNPAVLDLLAEFRTSRDGETLVEIVEQLGFDFPQRARADRSGRVVMWPRTKSQNPVTPVTEEFDETDDTSFSGPRTLEKHTAGVVKHTRVYAYGCGLSKELTDDLVLAAKLHDWGKCDERFQSWLLGRQFDGKTYFAKSGEVRNPADNRRYRQQAGYPENARHEAASVMAACASGRLADAHDRDLVLHLIGSHHGWGRPWFPVWKDEPDFRIAVNVEGISFECSSGWELARIDSEWADRFVHLNKQYGYWQLAYLESILRRADCMQSRKESEECHKLN